MNLLGPSLPGPTLPAAVAVAEDNNGAGDGGGDNVDPMTALDALDDLRVLLVKAIARRRKEGRGATS